MMESSDWVKRKNLNVWRNNYYQIWYIDKKFEAMIGHISLGIFDLAKDARIACINHKEGKC